MFLNRTRLPFKITRPQFPSERTVFRKADGSTKTLSAIVRKVFEGESDWMPEIWHERLQIALNHDEVTIEGDKYLGGVTQEGDYDIDWQSFLDYPTAKAKFKVNVTPFDASNSNCQTCSEATQIELQDNYIGGDLYGSELVMDEDTEYQENLSDNDDICCSPAVFSITSFNTDYLDSAVIDQSGILTVVTKTGLVDANAVLLATYRVTCPNGAYDEADVYGNINGSVAGCLAPSGLAVDGAPITSTTATPTWDAPSPVPADGYIWELRDINNIGVLEQSGTTASLSQALTGLTPGREYRFYVKSDCGATESNFVSIDFTTSVETSTCGQYELTYTDPDGISSNYADVTYFTCNSVYHTVRIFHGQTRTVCAMQTAPADPVSIESDSIVFIDYQGVCD